MCVNLQVTGDGTDLPDGTLGTALYTETDPGILFNLYTTFSSYTMPGPDIPSVFGGSGSSDSSATSAAATSSAAATTAAAATSSAVATSSAAPETTSSAAAVVAAASSSSSSVAPVATAAPTKSCNKRRHARQLKN